MCFMWWIDPKFYSAKHDGQYFFSKFYAPFIQIRAVPLDSQKFKGILRHFTLIMLITPNMLHMEVTQNIFMAQ